MEFSEIILGWYDTHKRDLPWRQTRDPYRVWLSEIILQQTRVAQGMPYYLRFVERFPEVCDLAEAPEQEVLKLWQGLGYYSRARNLHGTARTICRELGGRFPDTYQGLRSLKGVGPYTAAAIGSICYGLPTPVVDGNVYRVLARYFGVEIPVDSSGGRRYFEQLAHEVMDARRIGEYNQAVMEFGAVQCVPQSPDCASCPLADSCWARAAGKVSDLPAKGGRAIVRKRYFHYIMPVDNALNTFLLQRNSPGIWRGLYEFPLLESEAAPNIDDLAQQLEHSLGIPGVAPERVVCFNRDPLVHKLSHQHLYTTFWIAYLDRLPEGALSLEMAGQLPVPVLIANFMETVKNSYF